MTDKKISVIIPVRNAGEYFKEALTGLLGQTFSGFELIIIDDSDIYLNPDELIDPRIKYYRGNNKGIAAALNYGLSMSSFDIIARADADDICHKSRFEKQILFLEKTGLDAAGCNMIYINDKGAEVLKKNFPETSSEMEFYMPVNTCLPHPTLIAHKKIIERAGGYNEDMKLAEDLDLFLRMIKNGAKLGNLQEYLYYYRIRKDINLTYNNVSDCSYEIGMKYLESVENSGSSSGVLLQKALLEYYKGDLKKSRKYFTMHFGKKPLSILKYCRHFIFTLTGNKFIRYLRKKELPQRVNRFLLKFFRIDMQFRKH